MSWLKKSVASAAVAAAASVGATCATPLAQAAPASPLAPVPVAQSLTGKTIFLDPGHQGSAAGHDMNKQVPDGRGGKKACQTSGATGVNGAAEHTVNWDVSQLVKAAVESQGARVVLSRNDDTGWGGCVDERAAAASRSGAALAVSLHADSTSAGADAAHKGFHMIVPALPLPDAKAQQAQSGGGRKASTVMRDSFKKAGFAPANYAGVNDGIQTRSDIAGSNLTTVPLVFVEMGNLSNPTEAAQLASKEGQLKYATAIADGILTYAGGASAAAPKSGSTTSAPGTTTTGTTRPGTTGNTTTGTTTPGSTTPSSDIDTDSLAGVIPLIEKLFETKDPKMIEELLTGPGQDVGSQVLKAMLSVVYSLFGGKLPIG